mgnify:CR=1 FL=1
MSKLDELLRELCPNGVEHKRIGDFAVCFPGATPKTTHPEYWENGTIPWMSSGEVNQEEVTFTEKKITQKGYDETSTKMVPVGTVVIALAGQGKTRGKVAITRIPLCTNQSLCAIVVDETVISKYLFHYLRSQYARIREISSGDGTRGGLNLKMIKAYVVPVPPIEVQEEIVRILDSYTEKIDELIQNLMTEITARKTQYNYYRDKLLKAETNAHKYKLGEIATVTKLAGFEFTNYVTYSENGNIIALRGLNVKNGRLDLHDVKYVDKSDFSKLERSKLHIGDMLFTYVGTVGQVAIVDEEDKYYLAPNVALIRCDKEVLLPQYMKYYFQTTQFWDKQIRRLLQSSSMQNIPMEKIRKFEIAVPPLDVQNHIVNVLDNFERICSDLNIGLPAEIEARQKQYEYYRDKLLTFAETGNTILSRAEQSRAEQSRAEQSRALIKLLQYVFGYVRISLGDIGSICMCKRILKSQTNTVSGVPFYKIGTFGKEADAYISQETFNEYRSKYNFPKKGDVLISAAGTIGRTVVYDGKPAYFQDSNIVWIDNDESIVLNSYLRYCYELKPWKASEGGTIPRLYNDNIAKAVIAVPPIEEQKRIVSILDRFDAICNDLTSGLPAEIEARQKQYEYYRDKLLNFKELN